MALKDKRYKYVEDIIEDYLYLIDERIELPLSLKKTKDKLMVLRDQTEGRTLDKQESEDFFKLFNQEKKLEERKTELESDFAEVENNLKEFLQYVDGYQVTYEKKDDVEKAKITYLFWMENGEIKSNRELSRSTKFANEYA
jgi:hypothetical protein